MTTAHESTNAAPSAPWVQHGDNQLATGLQQAANQAGVTALAFEVAAAPPTALADALPGQPRVLWRARDGAMHAGIGAAITLHADGDARFTAIAEQAAAVTWHTQGVAHGPRFFGGFAFCAGGADDPAWRGFGDAWFMLPRWNYQGTTLTLFVGQEELQRQPSLAEQLQRELATLRECLQKRGTLRAVAAHDGASPLPAARYASPQAQTQWRAHIEDIVAQIRRGAAAKIVAARHIDIGMAAPVELGALVETLWSQQPHCYGIAISPGGGAATFIAAPPERLLKKHGDQVTSEAVAGSLPNSGNNADAAKAELLGDAKNRAEHQWVIDAVAAELTDAGVKLSGDRTTSVRSFRNIHHLHTPIAGKLQHPRHVLELVKPLHPTPAVGGTPRSAAMAWIAEHEAPRGYYASPVGWFAPNGDGEFAVAIRSALFGSNTARLWAGAGIVEASDADVEFAETETKLQTMLGALAVGVRVP